MKNANNDRGKTKTFTLDLKLSTSESDNRELDDRFYHAFLVRNKMTKHALKCIRSYRQDTEYRELVTRLKALPADAPDAKKTKKDITDSMNALQKRYGLSEYQFQAWVKEQQHRNKAWLDSDVAQKLATWVWQGTAKVLFSNGKTLHFKRLNDFLTIEGKSNKSGIRYRNRRVEWLGLDIGVQIDQKDDYAREALTHRVKYCRITRKAMGTRWHYYVQLVLEGTPPPKHVYPESRTGVDPGTSCMAAVSASGCILQEILPVKGHEKKITALQQKLDRSRRATNPDKYNADGTAKKKRGEWVKSKTYKRAQMRLKTLRRKDADTLKCRREELANGILGMGSDVYAEKMDYAALQKKAKESHVSEKTGRNTSRRRFGKSILVHAPSALMTAMNRKLAYTGKEIHYVDTRNFRASQYDHVVGDYEKHGLSERWKDIGGRAVQRDLYSAFLLMNAKDLTVPDREACEATFEEFLVNQDACIEKMKAANISKPSVFGF